MKSQTTRRTAACLIVAVTVLSSIPVACEGKTPHATGTLGKGDYGVMEDTPYYGGFGAGFLHINADGTYGGGEIRSGDLGLQFYGPTFGGPYRFQLNMKDAKGEWNGDLVAGGAAGMKVEYLPLFPKCQYTFKHQAMPLDVKMEAFAPWIPGDSKMSSLPVLFFDFQITNPDEFEKTVSLACMVPNPECDNGSPVREEGGQVDGLLLQSKRAGGGTLCGMIRNDGDGQVTWGSEFTKGKLRTFLPGSVTWGGLDYSCVEPDCDQKFVLTFERPFELEFLGVRNSGKPTVRATQGGKAVPCSIKAVDADEFEVRFDKPLQLDAKPLEVRIGSK
ncbi:MAG: GH116 family glycosyl-hydrolase [Verrucomicrobia bacterium]|nr:GH116 family glycosyl-hydrolase [Verrucomicrobiota bacterium]